MNQPIEEVFEDYLAGKATLPQQQAVEAELGQSPEFREMVDEIRRQAAMMRTLRPTEDVELSPGFYARVIACIDQQRPVSLWSLFLDPFFGKRLVYASLALLAFLTTIAITTENETIYAGNGPVGVMAEHEYPPTPGVDQQHDRDVVFVNLATWRDGTLSSTPEPEFLPSASQ